MPAITTMLLINLGDISAWSGTGTEILAALFFDLPVYLVLYTPANPFFGNSEKQCDQERNECCIQNRVTKSININIEQYHLAEISVSFINNL